MARISSQKAVEKIGGNQFELVLIAAQRAREILHGSQPRLKTGNGACVTALKEIEEGLYTKEDYHRKTSKRNPK